MGVLQELEGSGLSLKDRRKKRKDRKRIKKSTGIDVDNTKLTYHERNGTTRVGDFLRGVKGVAPEIMDLVGAVIPGAGGLSIIADKIRNTDSLTPLDKEIALRELELDMVEAEQITKRWEADMASDSWLSKNIRPMVLGFAILCSIVILVLDSSLAGFDVEEHWVDLLKYIDLTALGGYFTLRQWGEVTKIKTRG